MTSEEQLCGVLSTFARNMTTEFSLQCVLGDLVRGIVDILPISGAGVTLIACGEPPCCLATSGESALRFEQLQSELNEGPCLVAYRTGEAVAVPDLKADRRFTTFAARACEAGLGAVFTFPLRHRDARLGALDLYQDHPGPLDSASMTSAETLADVAAAYVISAQARADMLRSSDRSREPCLYDGMTGLPNRHLLLERMTQALARRSRSGSPVAVLFADLDGFKLVNDIHGHRIGDQLLVGIAERLSRLLRPSDTLARLSGDEFVILCEDLAGPTELAVIQARILGALAQPFQVSSRVLHTGASVGVAFAGVAEQTAEDLLNEADLAMYQAKRARCPDR